MRLLTSMRSMVTEPSPFQHLLSSTGMKHVLKSIIPFAVADHGAPQARLPYAVVEESR